MGYGEEEEDEEGPDGKNNSNSEMVVVDVLVGAMPGNLIDEERGS